MPKLIKNPTLISAEGNKPKRIHEYIGRVNTETENVSIAHMLSRLAGRNPVNNPNSLNIPLF
jgi:hypothetical protein